MAVPYTVIEDAYEFANFGDPGDTTAYVSTETGETYYLSEYGDSDELPADFDDSDAYIAVPDKRELDQGQRLVWDFVSARLPEDADRVRRMFSRRGAYGQFKDFLNDRKLLDEWFAFETARTREALLAWCRQQGIEVREDVEPRHD